MTGNVKIKSVDEINNLIDYLDTEEKLIIIDNTILTEEWDSYIFSYNSEDNNEKVLSFDNINYYEELNYKFDINTIDNEINIDEDYNLSINSLMILKENINEEDKYFDIDKIEKERGFLTLFSSTNNNISQNLNNLISFNEIKNSLHILMEIIKNIKELIILKNELLWKLY